MKNKKTKDWLVEERAKPNAKGIRREASGTNAQKQNATEKTVHKYAEPYTKYYTNKYICKQIEKNCISLRFYIFMLLLGIVLISLSCITAYASGEELRDHPLGFIIGGTILIVIGIWSHLEGSLNMIKHIRPACSGRRYTPQEIDEQANHPDTVWDNTLEVLITPKALIGLNKGLTVVEYEDAASIRRRVISHSQTRKGMRSSRIHRRYYNTYLIIVKTKTHKRLKLTEIGYQYPDSYKKLLRIFDEKGIQVKCNVKDT